MSSAIGFLTINSCSNGSFKIPFDSLEECNLIALAFAAKTWSAGGRDRFFKNYETEFNTAGYTLVDVNAITNPAMREVLIANLNNNGADDASVRRNLDILASIESMLAGEIPFDIEFWNDNAYDAYLKTTMFATPEDVNNNV
jgi:hypothetical protein